MISLADLGKESSELYKEHKAASASTRWPDICFFDFLNKLCATCLVNDGRLVAMLIQRKWITFHNLQSCTSVILIIFIVVMLRVFATGSLLKISEKLNEVVATARNMCNALTHCLDLLSQQEEVSWIWKNFVSWIIDSLSREALRNLYFHWPLSTYLVRNGISSVYISFSTFFPSPKLLF